jgi:glutathione peroxidase
VNTKIRTIYDFSVEKANGQYQSMDVYKGKTLLIVNTASNCGFSSQFKELQRLYEKYNNRGLVVLGFPSGNFNNQEFNDIEETMEFCEVNYKVNFPMFKKIDVKGENAHPLFIYLSKQKKGFLSEGIKWNFTKFLIDCNGNVVERFAPQTSPLKMSKSIDEIIQ